jgi:hypothetical protein
MCKNNFYLVSSLLIKQNLFIYVIISGNRNVTKNILKYKDHSIYIHHNLNVKSKAISLTIEETGTILLLFTKKLGSVP